MTGSRSNWLKEIQVKSLHANIHVETQTLTSELNLSWQTLHEMTCFFLGTKVTPKVWLMTAFCTGSICRRHTEVRGHEAAQDDIVMLEVTAHSVLTPSHQQKSTQSYRVEVWEKPDWRRRLDGKRQERFHHHRWTSGTYESWQCSAHCTTPTSWKQRHKEFESLDLKYLSRWHFHWLSAL